MSCNFLSIDLSFWLPKLSVCALLRCCVNMQGCGGGSSGTEHAAVSYPGMTIWRVTYIKSQVRFSAETPVLERINKSLKHDHSKPVKDWETKWIKPLKEWRWGVVMKLNVPAIPSRALSPARFLSDCFVEKAGSVLQEACLGQQSEHASSLVTLRSS